MSFSFGGSTPGGNSQQPNKPLFGTGATPSFGAAAPPASNATTGGFSFGGPAATSTPAAKPGGFSFGTPQTTTTTAASNNATSTPSFSFGAPTTTSTPAPATSTPAATGGLFGSTAPATPSAGGGLFGGAGAGAATGTSGGLFGAKPATATTSATAAATPAPSGSSLFGGFSATTSSTPAATASTTTAATPAAAPSFSFGGKPAAPSLSTTTPATTTTAATTTTSAPLSFSLSTATTTAATTSSTPATLTTAPATTTAPASSTTAPSTTTATATTTTTANLPNLKNKTLEDILNRWTSELETYTKDFHNLAHQVSTQDRYLIDQAAKISKLVSDVSTTESFQKEVSESLDFIEAQQMELGSVLDTYEKTLMDVLGSSSGAGNAGMTSADADREKSFFIAETLNKNLDDLSKQLSAMITDMNALQHGKDVSGGDGDGAEGGDGNKKKTNADESGSTTAMSDIIQILNHHLVSLNWLESSTNDAFSRVRELASLAGDASIEQERVLLRLGSGAAGGASRLR